MYTKLTVVIPTYNRQKYLMRSVEFWQKLDLEIIIIDGSDRELDERNKKFFKENTRYIYDISNPDKRLSGITKFIKTKYTCLVSDDEFYLPTAILASINELENDDSLVACMGEAIGFRYKNDKIEYNEIYTELRNYQVNNENKMDRLRQHMREYACSTIYAVCRTNSWIWAIETSAKINCNVFAIFEYSFEMLIACEGKSKIIPYLHWMRSFEQGPYNLSNEINIVNWWFSISRKNEKENYVKLLSEEIKSKYNMGYIEVKKNINEAIEAFIMRAIREETEKLIELRWIFIDKLNFKYPKIIKRLKIFKRIISKIMITTDNIINLRKGTETEVTPITLDALEKLYEFNNIKFKKDELDKIELFICEFHRKLN